MAGMSLRKHDENATRHYLMPLSFSRRKQNELYSWRAQALQCVQKAPEPEDPVPWPQRGQQVLQTPEQSRIRPWKKHQHCWKRETGEGEGKREVKLVATTGFLVLKHGPNTMFNIIAQLGAPRRGGCGDPSPHKLTLPHRKRTPVKNTTTEVLYLSLKELE